LAGTQLLYHDSTPSHTELSVQKLLTKNKNQVFHLLSSPTDTYLFPELEVSVMGCQCEAVEEIQDTPLEQLTQISSKSYMECWEI